MNFDYSYDIRFTYSAVETNLAIITASGPALRPLFKIWFPRLLSSMKASNRNYRYRDTPYALDNTKNTNKSGTRDTSSKPEQPYATPVSSTQTPTYKAFYPRRGDCCSRTNFSNSHHPQIRLRVGVNR